MTDRENAGERAFDLHVTCTEGFWAITSKDAVNGGSMLVGESSLEAALNAVPDAIASLEEAIAAHPGAAVSVESRAALTEQSREGRAETGDEDRMIKIDKLIADMQDIRARFGNTCVYIRRGGVSWGAVALHRRDDDKKNEVFDLQAQHDRDMLARYEQIERLIKDRDEWRNRAWIAEKAATPPQSARDADEWQPIETAPKDEDVWILACVAGTKIPMIAGWDDGWFAFNGAFKGEWKPTHWMPMPTPPKSTPVEKG